MIEVTNKITPEVFLSFLEVAGRGHGVLVNKKETWDHCVSG
jgi:hypothetical protein